MPKQIAIMTEIGRSKGNWMDKIAKLKEWKILVENQPNGKKNI